MLYLQAKRIGMPPRVRLTNETLNCYGTWLVTAGGDISQFLRNPILLYMHRRGTVIGLVEDIKVEGDEITGVLKFDGATDLSRQTKQQYECGSLRMVSVGIDIIELSDAPELLKPGQTCMTVTKWKLREVSLVDLGANDDAIRLHKDGQMLELNEGGESCLPRLNNNNKSTDKMERNALALLLGLPETATEAQIQARITELMGAETSLQELRRSAITLAVDTAVKERKITADKKEHFVKIGEQMGVESLQATLDAMSPMVKLSKTINQTDGGAEYKKLSDVPSDQLADLKENEPETYRKLFKSEYGFDCEL